MEMLEQLQRMNLHAMAISAGNTLALWKAGLLPEDTRAETAEHFREIARLFEAMGGDENAANYWTAARLLDGTARKA
jgi:hypothetical protein